MALRSKILGLVGLEAQAMGCLGLSPTADPAAHIQTTFADVKCGIWVQSHCTDKVESWRSGGAALGAHGLNSLVLGSLMGGLLYREPLPGAKANDAEGFTDPDR